MENTDIPTDEKLIEYIKNLPSNQDTQSDSNKFFEIIYKISNGDVNIENFRMAKEWLKLAKDDLETSKLLYDNKHYRNSIFLLQQSVEKTVKADYTAFSLIPKKQIRKIGHKTPLAFVNLLKQEWVGPFLALVNKQYSSSLNKNIEILENLINNKDDEMALMNEEEISKFLSLCNIYDDDTQFMNFLSYYNSSEKQIITDRINMGLACLSSLITLSIISLITYPHITYTRYPDGKIKPEIYNENLGIVKKSKEIFELVDKTIYNLEKTIESEETLTNIRGD